MSAKGAYPIDADRVDAYQLEQELGAGGMGRVFRARRDTGEIVALKTLAHANESLLRQIRREVTTLASFDHPAIISIIDHGVSDGSPWYAMPLVSGPTLASKLASSVGAPLASTLGAITEDASIEEVVWWTQTLDEPSRAYPPRRFGSANPIPPGPEARRELLELLRRLCFALAYIHGEGVVHRDLKPANILLSDNGDPLLIDFGLAVPYDFAGTDGLEVEHGAGTPFYMSPEQVEARPVDPRSDLYSLGCLLFEVLTGRPPFVGETPYDIAYARTRTLAPLPSEFADVPRELDGLVARLLETRPEDRFGDATEVAARLADHLGVDPARPTGWPAPRGYLFRPELAGRTQAVEALRSAALSTSRNRGASTLLVGGIGAGKTRLAAHLAHELRHNWTIVSGSAVDPQSAGSAPLSLFKRPVRALLDYCTSRGPLVTEEILGSREARLATVFPAVAELWDDDGPEPELRFQRAVPAAQLAVDLAEVLLEMASPQPLMLVLEDLQWADEHTLEMLSTMLAVFVEGGAFVLLTSRPDERIDRLEVDGIHALEGLDANAIRVVASGMLGRKAPGNLASEVVRLSGGNPLFVQEYLRLLLHRGLLVRRDGAGWALDSDASAGVLASAAEFDVPGRVLSLLRARVEGLAKPAATLAAVCAVLGDDADLATVAAVAGSDLDLDVAMHQALNHAVVEWSGGDRMRALGDHLRFVHGRLRDVCYDLCEEEQRANYHAASASALAANPARSRDFLTIGFHWARAGDSAGARAAYEAGLRAARARHDGIAERRFLEAWLSAGGPEDDEGVRIRLDLGRLLLARLHEGEAAVAPLRAAISLADAFGLQTERSAALGALALVQRMQGDIVSARETVTEALASLPDGAPEAERADVLASAAQIERHLGQTDTAIAHWERAAELQPDDRRRATYLYALANTNRYVGNLSRASELYARARQGLAGTEEEAICLNGAGSHALETGDFAAAASLFERSHEIAVAAGRRAWARAAMLNLGWTRTEQGYYDEGASLMRKALEMRLELDRTLEGYIRTNLATVDCRRGHLETGVPALEAIRDVEPAYEPRLACTARLYLGQAYLAQSRPGKAVRELRRLLELLETTPERFLESRALITLAAAERQIGDVESASSVGERAERCLADLSDPVGDLLLLAERVQLEKARGEDASELIAASRAALAELDVTDESMVARAIAEASS